MPYSIDPYECIVCHCCVYSCPKSAITGYLDRVEIDFNKCIECGQCKAFCPVDAIKSGMA